jgi:hypothetical protein
MCGDIRLILNCSRDILGGRLELGGIAPFYSPSIISV